VDETLAWREAAVEQMGPDELRELVQMYPNFAVDALHSWLADENLGAGWPEGLVAELELLGGPTISLVGIDSLLTSLQDKQLDDSQNEGVEAALLASASGPSTGH
jgi:hypothetical protein